MADVSGWLEERLEISKLAWLGTRRVPRGVNLWYTFGAATFVVFIVLVLTGAFLIFNYDPSPDHAYDSVQYTMNSVQLGSFVRSLHHWAAYAMVLLVAVHAWTVYFTAAYRYPRELTWVVGVVLLLLVLGMAFTGYLLPWDQEAYWAIVIGSNIAGEAPLIGGFLKTLLIGGAQIGTVTLTRFFTFHVAILPGLLFTFIALHLFLVIRLGVSQPPESTALAYDE